MMGAFLAGFCLAGGIAAAMMPFLVLAAVAQVGADRHLEEPLDAPEER